jgi:hypothetical protein
MFGSLKGDICNLRVPGALACEVDSCRVEYYLPAGLRVAIGFNTFSGVKLTSMTTAKSYILAGALGSLARGTQPGWEDS